MAKKEPNLLYSINDVGGFPSLTLDNGQNFGTLIRWNAQDGGIAVTAGNIRNTVLLNETNCNLPAVRQKLASLITTPA